MKINRSTRIVGQNVILIPYKEKHVDRYHEWMKSPELQYLTASEPLTLEEERRVQKEWLEDPCKCTFIVLDKQKFELTKDEIEGMIGDTNLFFNDTDDQSVAEAEIMIAEPSSRGKKRGWEAMVLMLRYGVEVLQVSKYRAKIKIDNAKSIRMFNKLGFHEVERSIVFQEITLEKEVSKKWLEWLKMETMDSIRDDLYE